jgi:hypothetical protein
VHLLPAGAAIALVLIAVVPLAAYEVMQAAVVPAVVTESATLQTLGAAGVPQHHGVEHQAEPPGIHHHRWDIQRVGRERAQEPRCAELQPEAQPVVITAPPRD